MRTTKQVIEQTNLPPKLVRSVIRQLGDKSYLEDIANHGIDGGFHGFIYYHETDAFFRRNRADIVQLVKDQARDFGQDAISFVASFRCVEDDDQNRESIARALYGRTTKEDTGITNALAWFAGEEVARAFMEE